MKHAYLVRIAVLLLPFLSLVVLSGCPESSGSHDGRGVRNEEPGRHGSEREGPGGMMGGGM